MPTRAVDEKLLREHLDELELRRFSKSNLELAERVLALLFHHLSESGIDDIRSVDGESLVSFMVALERRKGAHGRQLAPGTRSTYLAAVKRFFAYLDRRSVLLHNPAAHLRLPRAQRLPRFVPTEKQVEKLLDMPPWHSAVGMRDRAVLETFYGTAVRIGECQKLDVDDVDLQKRTLVVRSGKGRKDRVLPIPRKTLQALDRYLESARLVLLHDPKEHALFLNRIGGRLGRIALGRIVRDYGAAAGIPGLHPHALRHACATHLIKGGADLAHVQKILGHSQITTTAEYVKLVIADLKKLIETKHPSERRYRRRKGK